MDSQTLFRRRGEYWVIAYEGDTLHLRDAKGLHYLAQLLRRPGEPISATELAQQKREEQPAPARPSANDLPLPVKESERARVNVTRAIAAALKRIAAQHIALGQHLSATVKTGTCCRYDPDPRVPIAWEVT